MGKNKEYQLAIKIAGEVEKSFSNSVNLTQRQLRSIAVQAAKASTGMSNSWATGFDSVEKGLNAFDDVAGKVFSAAAKAAAVAATAVAGIATASIAVGSEYEAQMSTVQSISNSTSAEMVALGDKAKEMGATTVFSATEAGQAMEYMAMAGWKTEDMLNGIEGIMNLAAASGEDLATTSDIVTDALTAFGLTAADSTRFADVLAAASSNANTNVSMMGETFSYVAPVAGALGYSVEDTSLAIGLLANSGIKASAAGTALRKIFSNTAQGIDLTSSALGEFRIETANADGSMRELRDVLPELREAFASMTEQEQAANAEAIAGKTAMSGLLALVNASETDYNKLANAIDNSAGAAERMSDIRLDNLQGDITLLKSAGEGLGIEIYDQMNEGLRGGVQIISGLAADALQYLQQNNFIEDFTEGFQKNVPTVIRYLKDAGNAIVEFADPFLNVAEWMLDNPHVVTGAITAIGTTLITLKVAVGVHNLATSFAGLAGVLTNPFALGILAVAGAIGGATGVAAAVKKANKELAKDNMAEKFGDISLSIEELDEVVKHILDDGNLTKLNEAMSSFDELENITDGISDSLNELNKLNWKVSVGMELDDAEKQTYQDSIVEFIEQSKEAVQQQQYAMSLNLELFTNDDEMGNQIREDTRKFYEDNQATVAELGTDLQNAVNTAFEDGFLSFDESQKIQELQAKIASMTEKLANAEYKAKLKILDMDVAGANLTPESFKNTQAELAETVEAATKQYEEAFAATVVSLDEQKEQGKLTPEEYDERLAYAQANYLKNRENLVMDAYNFSMDTIMEKYGEELDAAIPEFREKYDALMTEMFTGGHEDSWNNDAGSMWSWIRDTLAYDDTLNGEMREVLSQLIEGMQPTVEMMSDLEASYKEIGYIPSASITEGINEAATLGVMANGDEASIWTLVSDSINNDAVYQATMTELSERGQYVPEAIEQGALSNKTAFTSAALGLHTLLQDSVTEQFQNPIKVTPKYDIQMPNLAQSGTAGVGAFSGQAGSAASNAGTTGAASGASTGISNVNIESNAKGGLIKSPTLSTFAEECPEMAIPINGSARSIELWEQTGEMLGVKNRSRTEKDESYAGEKTSLLSIITDNVPGYARGGLISEPTLATFAEESPEMAIPINGSAQSISLWEQTGELLKSKPSATDEALTALDNSSNTQVNITNAGDSVGAEPSMGNINFAPQYIIQGSANKEDIEAVNQDAFEKFELMMERHLRNKGRFSYA